MSSIINRIRTKYQEFWVRWEPSTDPTGLELYWREKGPICYDLKILWDPVRRAALPGLLLASGLRWYWTCDRNPLIQLTQQTALAMAEALHQYTVLQQSACGLTLIGCDPHANQIVSMGDFQHLEDFHAMLLTFSRLEAGPINMVLVQEGDMAYECVFVPHIPVRPVQDLLDGWGVREENIRRVYRDNSIRGIFEKLFELPARQV